MAPSLAVVTEVIGTVWRAGSPGLGLPGGGGGPHLATPHPGFSPQAGAHAALHALQASLCPGVHRLLRLLWPDRLRWDQR